MHKSKKKKDTGENIPKMCRRKFYPAKCEKSKLKSPSHRLQALVVLMLPFSDSGGDPGIVSGLQDSPAIAFTFLNIIGQSVMAQLLLFSSWPSINHM